jgi:N-acetylglucosaminyl-diphospho-decaprenol L-rhamnosyltransferase
MHISPKLVTLSVVSHGQSALMSQLLSDLEKLPIYDFELIVTLNLPEDQSLYEGYSFPLTLIFNKVPKGFGANHNEAFFHSKSKWFGVINPDIRIQEMDFSKLILPFQNPVVAAVAPVIVSGEGKIEDSARNFPTLFRLLKRLLLRHHIDDYYISEVPYVVDWVAGMFVIFRKEAFAANNGYDSVRFFMYMEDVDICKRFYNNGLLVMVNPNVRVIHHAQRASHRNLKHMWWHFSSAIRYLSGI